MEIITIDGDRRFEVIFKKKLEGDDKQVEALRDWYRFFYQCSIAIYGHQDGITYFGNEIPDAVFEDLPA